MSNFFLRFLLLICFISYSQSKTNKRSVLHQNVAFPTDTAKVIQAHGFKAETHTVKTEDGYYLTLHRITGRQNVENDSNHTKPVALLGHGIFCSSSTFTLVGPEKGLGYVLSDAGYDVWLANFRGNKYSQKHELYGNDTPIFWDFSWHEMGQYDMPAMINYILNETEVEKIFYIGHSQGTTVYFVYASLYPEIAEKYIHASVGLAPVIFLSNIESVAFKILAHAMETLIKTTFPFLASSSPKMASLFNIETSSGPMKEIMNYLCDSSDFVQPMCENFLFMLGGYQDQGQINTDLLPIIWSHLPTGASVKQLAHYSQLITSGEFQMFDNGMAINLMRYFSTKPKKYNLGASRVQTALFYSDNDWISTPQDIERLRQELIFAEKFRVPYDQFTHLDFVWAKDVKELLYNQVLNYMNQFL